MLASEKNDPAVADVYAIRFDPFTIDRITTDKAISSLSADDRRVIVAAADEKVDKLALLTGAGELGPIPGLGRPPAYSPTLRDGLLYFDDAQGSGAKGKYQYFSWNLDKQSKSLLFASKKDLGAPKPMADGRLLITKAEKAGQDQLVIREKSGKETALPLTGDIAAVRPGTKFVAVTLVASNAKDGGTGQVLLLFNPENGEKQVIPNLQIIAWSPDGTQFLARRTETPNDSRLVILDPTKAPVELGTVPNLSIYGGAWVRGGVPA